MAKLILPGFPTEVSSKIEMPDIAELLLYPMFWRTDVELFRKHATDFQKKLLDMCPLKNNKRHVIIFSSVQILDPMKRLFTNAIPGTGREWHIDGLGDGGLWTPSETVHFLIGHTTSPTEFTKNPLSFDIPNDWGKGRFNAYINEDPVFQTIVPQPIELGRIYTFTHHVHRAVPTKGIQFRYTWRVRETDQDKIEHQLSKVSHVNDLELQKKVPNIAFGSDHVKVYVPRSFNGFVGGNGNG